MEVSAQGLDEPSLKQPTAQRLRNLGSIARSTKSAILATSALLLASTVQADGSDVMNGDGEFKRTGDVSEPTEDKEFLEAKNWILASDSYTMTVESDHSVKMVKSEDAEGFFDDGLTYLFQDNNDELQEVRPRHIYFEIKTESLEVESCDVRFYSVEKVPEPEDGTESFGTDRNPQDESQIVTAAPAGPNDNYRKIEFSDVAFFRLGYFDFMKLNTANMLRKYDESEWYNVDMLFDWDEQRVSIYVNDKAIKSDAFFTQRKDKLESGNALSIYGLTPGSTSYFKNLRMCSDVCDFREDQDLTDLSGAMLSYGSVLMGVTAMFVSLIA